MDPATTVVMNAAAPTSSPTAIMLLFDVIAENVENRSGLPFPRAKKVTPAKVSLMRSPLAIELRLMEKKSPAVMPILVRSRTSHRRMRSIAAG